MREFPGYDVGAGPLNAALGPYVQPYSYTVSLRVWHPNLDPAEITSALALSPSRTWKAGERRTSPKGQLLEGIWDRSYWCSSVLLGPAHAVDEPLERALARLTLRLNDARAFLLRVRAEGGVAEYYVGVHAPESFGYTFGPELLNGCAELGLALSVEVYPVPQSE